MDSYENELNELSNKLNDDELLVLIELNNEKMQDFINKDLNNLLKNDEFRELFLLNLKLYSIANKRGIKVLYFSFMEAVATMLGYEIDKDTYKITNKNKLTKKR